MKEQLDFFLFALTSLFTLLNPVSVLPMLISATQGFSREHFRKLSMRACFAALVAMLFFSFTGQMLFSFFSISIHSLRMVGGILFLITGYDMLQAKQNRMKVDEEKPERVEAQGDEMAITPLGIPMLCGPGTITATIVMTQESESILQKGLLYGAMVVAMILCFLVFIYGPRLLKLVGESGNKVFLRVMGLIMMVIAIEFFFSGLEGMLERFEENSSVTPAQVQRLLEDSAS